MFTSIDYRTASNGVVAMAFLPTQKYDFAESLVRMGGVHKVDFVPCRTYDNRKGRDVDASALIVNADSPLDASAFLDNVSRKNNTYMICAVHTEFDRIFSSLQDGS